MFKTHCYACHQGRTAAAKLDLSRFSTIESILAEPRLFDRVLARVRNSEMPPKSARPLPIDLKENFTGWLDQTLLVTACAGGLAPGNAPLRRLNRNEYAATIRDLLNIGVNAGHELPADGAGGEGFDNAAETLFLSPVHAEKYLQAAREALLYGATDPKSRARFLIAAPDATTTPEQAARKVLHAFLPRAFRAPVLPKDEEPYVALFQTAQKRGEDYDTSIQYALQGALISPRFLFRLENPNPEPGPRLVGDYEMASRLSYFLWGTMPDNVLFELAAQGKLRDTDTLKAQVVRMLKDARSIEFAERFVEQWLDTRELGTAIKPDLKLFPAFGDAELRAAIRYEPILFFQELMVQNLSLLNLIDSKFTFSNDKLNRHYGFDIKVGQNPKRIELPEGSHRGGLLGMTAVLAVSSYPHRTSPVLRGKWVLEALLGTPPPPPPPNVPRLDETQAATNVQTLRERLTEHRRDPTCASCHNRIDPLGFGLENFDVLGRWRTEDAGKPIDAKGEMPDGSTFDGPEQLRAVLLQKKSVFVKNLTTKMLGYALGHGLTRRDNCIVDQIVQELEKSDYAAQTLVEQIVLSVPFRYQEGTVSGMAVQPPASKEAIQ